jgi:hypothetical protein
VENENGFNPHYKTEKTNQRERWLSPSIQEQNGPAGSNEDRQKNRAPGDSESDEEEIRNDNKSLAECLVHKTE